MRTNRYSATRGRKNLKDYAGRRLSGAVGISVIASCLPVGCERSLRWLVAHSARAGEWLGLPTDFPFPGCISGIACAGCMLEA